MPEHLRPPRRRLRSLRFGFGVVIVVVLFAGLAIFGAHTTQHGTQPTRNAAPAPLPPPVPPPGHTAFHISPHGDDSNPGTLDKPWRTIARAMAQTYVAGDQLLFQRGGEYFGIIDRVPTPEGSRRWVIGAYGEGAMPVITSAKILNNSAAWTMTAPNVWRINLNDPTAHGGWAEVGTNVGFLATGTTIHAAKKKALADLRAPWDFYDDDDTYLYVQSTGNPSALAPDLRAAPDSVLIRLHSNTEIDGIEMRDCGGHAIRGEDDPIVNVRVLDNYIHHIGGSYLIGYADDKVRYGNGIECLDSCADWLVQGNEVHDVYDSAFTCQGSGTTTNVRVTRNYFHDNSHNIEFWTEEPGGGLHQILIDDNDFVEGGGGWGGPARPDQENRAQFISYGWDLPADIVLTKNRVRGAQGSYVYHAPAAPHPAGWVFSDNDVQLAAGTLMQNGQPYTIDDAAAWAVANKTETGSTFEVSSRP
ncbi:right-handed parallel beta-helix repeat-containing protein [Candidatus Mycolicibacterium alkanivorans]|uniref:Right-handed parallel beta-helix repeat-containing protein n=1 Tax=Candidatus Mycolicibacterium alkanivorans TaxID=2954114 RepID=A0ABS9YXD5_9MYCO|nr:right-handed parallel beta-helix repeat-containing protein [Candidatus Mycolicibacterium alkanivorans]MCI4675906.1 right-handed parallel beta-helix repeat-containing protein [Candidatus Mycolicibacterium alkanivorans]